MIRFSVLMSVYKRENPKYMHSSLWSVFNQTLMPNEVILVEDGPLTQELYKVIDEFKQKYSILKVISLPQNKGLGKALNEGMKHCSFDYVARMDTDDECYPIRFEKQISFLEKHQDIDVVGCLTTEFNEDANGKRRILSIKHFPESVEENEKYSRKRCPVEHPAVVFKKQSVLNVGGYQHCFLFEDYHLWARMFVNGAKFYNIQEPLLYFRMTEDSFNRRGGWKYAVSELKALNMFRKIKFLSLRQFCTAVIIRFPVRVMPNVIRKFIYNNFLRSKGNN